MPAPEAFSHREAYGATWAHEQIHSIGHPSRLERPQSGVMGSAAYAREELVVYSHQVVLRKACLHPWAFRWYSRRFCSQARCRSIRVIR